MGGFVESVGDNVDCEGEAVGFLVSPGFDGAADGLMVDSVGDEVDNVGA